MKKQVLIFLTVFTILSTLAEEPTITNNPSVINLEQEKQIWKQTQHQSYLTHLAQRETFLQIENLLKSAVRNQQFSENTQELTKNLIRSIPEYPLQMDLILRFWETKIRFLKSNDEKNISLANNELDKLIAQNPLFITKSLKELKQKLKNLISDSK
ncbi:MAG: lytic murein transglycosylase, partial [Haemophilus seminalis]